MNEGYGDHIFAHITVKWLTHAQMIPSFIHAISIAPLQVHY